MIQVWIRRQRVGDRSVVAGSHWLTALLVVLMAVGVPVVAAADQSDASEVPEEDAGPEQPGDLERDGDRDDLQTMSRQQLEEQGFVFEDTLTERERAHATLFALTAGVILPGAGHWHLDDASTAMTLVGVDLAALGLIGTGVFLAVRPSGITPIDRRRREMWFLGTGMLATTWLVDIFGTAYRDELGIPASTRRYQGWGVGLNYHFWRPRDRSLRHVSSANFRLRNPSFDLNVRTSQELGLGMSDYEVDARWYPFVGTTPETRAGIGVAAQYMHYRLDEPFRRTELEAKAHASLNLGRVAGHLDRMTAGLAAGVAVRDHRQVGDEQDYGPLFSAPTWRIPMTLFLELNLTEQLRLQTSYQRNTTHLLGLHDTAIGIPTAELTYRSTERIDLKFSTAFGEGLGVGAGIEGWFGE